MILDPKNRFIIIVRAAEFGYPFDDGLWHVVSESPTYEAMRAAMMDIAWSVAGSTIEVALLRGDFGLNSKVTLRPLVTKAGQKGNLPNIGDIVKDSEDDLRGFRILVEASTHRYSVVRWREFLESGIFEGVSPGIFSMLKRLMPRAVFDPQKRSFWDTLKSPVVAYSLAAGLMVASISGIMLVNAAAEQPMRKLSIMEKRNLQELRDGAYDLIQRDSATGLMRRVRVYPEGKRVVMENDIDVYLIGKLPIEETRFRNHAPAKAD